MTLLCRHWGVVMTHARTLWRAHTTAPTEPCLTLCLDILHAGLLAEKGEEHLYKVASVTSRSAGAASSSGLCAQAHCLPACVLHVSLLPQHVLRARLAQPVLRLVFSPSQASACWCGIAGAAAPGDLCGSAPLITSRCMCLHSTPIM